MNKLRTAFGFSLVTVLVAIGLMGVLAAGISSLISTAMNNQKFIEQKQAVHTLQMGLLEIFSDRNLCRRNFNHPTSGRVFTVTAGVIDAANITPIFSADGVTQVLRIGDTYENNTLRLTNIRLQNWRPRVAPTAGKAPDEYKGSMDLIFDFDRIGNTGGLPSLTRRIQLAVELGGFTSGVINTPTEYNLDTCVAVGNDTNQPWRVTGSNDIFYNLGNVGIGVETPSQRLEVNGFVLAAGYLHTSDARLKKNIQKAPGLQLIHRLNGVSYTRIQDESEAFGLLAQQVETVAPHLVATDPQTGMKSLEYTQLIAPLIEATKELNLKIQANQLRIQQNSDQILKLRSRLDSNQNLNESVNQNSVSPSAGENH